MGPLQSSFLFLLLSTLVSAAGIWTMVWDPTKPLTTLVPIPLFQCGITDKACCPPDPTSSTNYCISNSKTHRECRPVTGESSPRGTCIACGTVDKERCDAELSGNHCQYPLDNENGKCIACGGLFQPACKLLQYECNKGCAPHGTYVDKYCAPCGEWGMRGCFGQDRAGSCTSYVDYFPCKAGLGMLDDICQPCGAEGQKGCTKGCNAGLKTKNKICTTACSFANQQPCDDGLCARPYQLMGGTCKSCGSRGEPECPSGGCKSPYKKQRGLCADCGRSGTLPCDKGCDGGMPTEGGFCSNNCGADGFPQCDNGCRAGLVAGPGGICEAPGGNSPSGVGDGNPGGCVRDGEHCFVGDSFPGAGPFCCGDRGLLFCKNGICVRGGP